MVAEVITEHYAVKIYPVGINDIKGEVGNLSYLREQFGLTASAIVTAPKKHYQRNRILFKIYAKRYHTLNRLND